VRDEPLADANWKLIRPVLPSMTQDAAGNQRENRDGEER